MTKIAILLDNFGHDGNGNAIARHTVYQYAKPTQELTAPTAELYQTRVRPQIGCGNKRDDWAQRALAKAGVKNAKFVQTEGDRSSGAMWLIYSADL